VSTSVCAPRTLLLFAYLIVANAASRPACAQATEFRAPRLTADGNGIAALRAFATIDVGRESVAQVLQRIAAQAGLNLTFDPTLPGIQRQVVIPTVRRAVAATLLLTLDGTPLAIEIGHDARLIVVASSLPRDTAVVVTGRVEDTLGRPLMGAIVRVAGMETVVHSTVSGRFMARPPRPGRSVIRVHLLGYFDAERTVTLAMGDSVDLLFRLRPNPLRLDAVRTEETSARRARFEDRPSVGTLSLGGAEIRSTPRFIEADVMRAVQLLPGVSARNDYSATLNVRGGGSDQNLVLLDGYPIYNPFHLGGLFSTFIAPTVGEVTLLSGGFPAPYGGRLSSVLDVHSADEERPGMHGTADVSLLSTAVSLSSVIGEGAGSWMIAGRRTYADAVADFVKSNAFPYHFSDAQAHFTHRLPGGAQLAVTAYSGLDLLATDIGTRDENHFDWGNEVVGTTVSKTFADHPTLAGMPLGERVAIEQRLSTSQFHTSLTTGLSSLSLHSGVRDMRAAGFITSYTTTHDRTLGYDAATVRTSYATSAPVAAVLFDSVSQHTSVGSLLYDDLWRVAPTLLLQVGGRLDYTGGRGSAGFSPRLSLKYFVTPDLAITAATGRYVQPIHSLGREDVPLRLFDFWIASDSALPVSHAWHYVLGAERRITPARTLRVEGFYKRYSDLLDANLLAEPGVPGDEFVVESGRSYGFDVLLQQLEVGRFSGWAAYTYALSTRTQVDGTQFFPGQDRRHDLNLVGNWRWPRYTVAARFGLATGTPYTAVLGDYTRRHYDPITQTLTDGNAPDKQFLTGSRNGERMPLTQRLDVSVTRNAHVRGVAVSPYFSIVNLYYARNAIAYSFDYRTSPPARTDVPGFPILPSFGVNIAW
jgi:hypothetical protein